MFNDDERPLWLPAAMVVAFLFFWGCAPKVLDDPKSVVQFKDFPYLWYAVAGCVQLFLIFIGQKGYEWSEFGDEERRSFVRVMLLAAVVVFTLWYGSGVLAAVFQWSYHTSMLIALITVMIFVIAMGISKRKFRSWD